VTNDVDTEPRENAVLTSRSLLPPKPIKADDQIAELSVEQAVKIAGWL